MPDTTTGGPAAPSYVIIKIGGRPAANPEVLDALVADIGSLATAAKVRPVLVHGGGADVTELSKRLGIEPRFVNGKRQTTPEEMQIVEAVLAGNVNSRLLRRCLAAGVPAIGLSGVDAGLFTAEALGPGNLTGRITATRPAVLATLAGAGFVPVVSSVSCDAAGSTGLNINADDAALALAVALRADCLIYLSDIPGILKDGQVLSVVTPAIAAREIANGTISGGMIPKVESSLAALEQGIGRIVIGGFQGRGDLAGFLDSTLGTSITGATGQRPGQGA
jgi:acetylglutamate kinase